jgi:hypothetical protein
MITGSAIEEDPSWPRSPSAPGNANPVELYYEDHGAGAVVEQPDRFSTPSRARPPHGMGNDRDRGGGGVSARRRRRRVGLFDVIMLLIVVAVAWLFLGQAGIVPPLPIGR